MSINVDPAKGKSVNKEIRWEKTGEIRPPRRGEWFENGKGFPEQAMRDFDILHLPIMIMTTTLEGTDDES